MTWSAWVMAKHCFVIMWFSVGILVYLTLLINTVLAITHADRVESGWSFQTPKTAFSGTFKGSQVPADRGRPRSWPPLPPTRTREIGPPHPDRQIWDRGHSFVASRSEKVGPPQNWEVPQNHDFEVIEPVNLGQLLILKCPRFLEMVIPKWLTRQISRLTRNLCSEARRSQTYRFVVKSRTNTRFASARRALRADARTEANRVFVLFLSTKRYA